MLSGTVGSGALQHVLIISKWELRQGFINSSNHNTAIHEFVHLIDKMDGTLDGVPDYCWSGSMLLSGRGYSS